MCNLYGERAQNVNTSVPVFNAVCDGKRGINFKADLPELRLPFTNVPTIRNPV
jgi:hypothetical protein